jgi:hypothetical protein
MSTSIAIEAQGVGRRQLTDRRSAKPAKDSRTRKAPHVVAILPRGEVIRNFVYSGALDEAAGHVDLTVLSVVPNQELFGGLQERFANVLALQESKEKWIVGIQRDLLDMAHGRWLWSEAAKERWRLRDREATTPALKLKRVAKKLACYPFSNRTGLSVLSAAERVSSRLFRSSDEYLDLFQRVRPSLVFNGSHVHSRLAMPVVEAAQWLGIPTATFIFSWDNLTSQGRIMPLYDYYLVWNEQIRQQLLQIYHSISPDQVFVTGTPQFDLHCKQDSYWTREEFCSCVGADPARPIVLYTTGMPNHMPGEPKIVEGIADLLREMPATCGSPQLLVRVYPKDRTGRFESLKQSRPDILFPEVPWEPGWLTPKVEDSSLLINTLRHASVGINVASTITLELCIFDKPVINVAYNPPGVNPEEVNYARYYDFDHYRPVVRSGAVVLARSEIEMRDILLRALSAPEADSALRAGLVKSMFGKLLDGQGGLRVARQLVSLAYKHSSDESATALIDEPC